MKKVISIVCVICILALTVGGLAAVSSGFQNWNVKTWFGRTEEAPAENPDDASGALVANAVSSNRMALASTAAASDGSVTVTAKVKDATGVASENIQSVTWALEWASAPMDSAMIPSSFVELTTNGTSATVKYKASFGTKINLKCTSTVDTAVTATCVLDCLARLSGITMKLPEDNTDYVLIYGQNDKIYTVANVTYTDILEYQNPRYITLLNSVNYGMYTVASSADVNCYLKASPAFIAAYGQDICQGYVLFYNYNPSQGPVTTHLNYIMTKLTDTQIGTPGFAAVPTPFYNALAATDNQFEIKIECGDRSIYYTLNIDANVTVNSIELDNSSITL